MKKLMIIKLLSCMFGLNFLEAQPISTNSGTIPNSELRYSVSLESVNKRLKLKFAITNDSTKSCNLLLSSFAIPGHTALFFSTDKTELDSKNDDWLNELIPAYNLGGFGSAPLAVGATKEIWIPLGDVYGKIYEKMKEHNVYVYWGVTVYIDQQALPRIGGMLTLPKGTKLTDREKIDTKKPSK